MTGGSCNHARQETAIFPLVVALAISHDLAEAVERKQKLYKGSMCVYICMFVYCCQAFFLHFVHDACTCICDLSLRCANAPTPSTDDILPAPKPRTATIDTN